MDEEGWRQFAASLPDPALHKLIQESKPLTPREFRVGSAAQRQRQLRLYSMAWHAWHAGLSAAACGVTMCFTYCNNICTCNNTSFR